MKKINSDFVKTISKYVELRGSPYSNLHLGRCAFHSENDLVSFIVNSEKNVYFCVKCYAEGDQRKFKEYISILDKFDRLLLPYGYK